MFNLQTTNPGTRLLPNPALLRPGFTDTSAPIPPTPKSNLPNFENPDVDAALTKKYAHLHRIHPIIETAFNAWVVFNGIFHAQEFLDTGVAFTNMESHKEAINDKTGIWNQFGKPSMYFARIGNTARVKLFAPEIPVSLGIGKNARKYREVNIDESRNSAVKFIQRFIPSFTMPQRWSYDNRRMVPIIEGLQPGPVELIEAFTRINLDWTPNDRYREEEDKVWKSVPLASGYISRTTSQGAHTPLGVGGYSGMLRTQLRIIPETFYFKPNYDSELAYDKRIPGSTGPLDGLNGIIVFNIEPIFYIDYPLEYAMWATSSSDVSRDFLPKNFVDLVNRFTRYDTGKAKRNPPEPRVGSFTKLRWTSAQFIRDMSITPRPRTNADDLTILHTGRIMWVPPTDAIDKYTELLRNAYDSETNEIIASNKVENLPNMIIYVDWVYNRVAFTNDTGNVNVEDLSGSIALDDISIYKILNANMNSERSQEFMIGDDKAPGVILRASKQLGIEFSFTLPVNPHLGYRSGKRLNLEGAWFFLGELADDEIRTGKTKEPMHFYEAIGGDIAGFQARINEEGDVRIKTRWESALLIVTEIRRLLNEVWSNWDRIDLPISTKMTTLRPYLVIATKYASDHRRFISIYNDVMARNSVTTVDRYAIKFETPNLPNIKSLMPHQAEAAGSLYKDPTSALLNVAAGGGKTLLEVISIMDKISKGIARGALLLVPGPLVKEMVKEINKYSSGKINAFGLRRDLLERLMITMRWGKREGQPAHFSATPQGYASLIKFLRGYPPNTIFIAPYSFLGQRRSLMGEAATRIPYGDTYIEVWPIAEFIRSLDPQIIQADEAHKLAKLSNQRSKAALQVISGGTRKMLASGTFLTNSPSDMVGQLAMFNPRVFGSAQNFANTYGNGNVTNVQLSKTGRPKALKAMVPYVQRIHKPRKTWAIYLPNMHEDVNMVSLTEKQAKFYDDILERALVQVEASMIKAKINPEEGDTTAAEQSKMEVMLIRHLARVEKFIVAPDSDAEYVNLSVDPPTGDDLISPHVRMVDRIFAAHMGLSTSAYGDQFNVQPDPTNKILIFAHHRVAAAHCFRHMAHKNQCILYMANRDMNVVKLYGESPPYGEQALIDFRNNPNIKGLVAPSMSITEGFNLQVASRMINLEVPWTPGRFEQEVSRIMRPDLSDTRVRTDLARNLILCNKPDGKPTVSVPKFGRLITKIVEVAKVDNSGDASWGRVEDKFADTELLRMSMEKLRPGTPAVPNKNQYTYADLEEHFKIYSTYSEWVNGEYDTYRDLIRRSVESHVGHPITDMDELAKLAMVPFDGTKIIPGSKEVFIPFVPGADIYDRYKVGPMTPLAQVLTPNSNEEETPDDGGEDDDDDEGIGEEAEEDDDAVDIKEGMSVITEFGPGRVAVIMKRGGRTGSIRVDVPGLDPNNREQRNGAGRVTLKRSIVYAPTTPEGVRRLDKLIQLAGRAGLPTLRPTGELISIDIPDPSGDVAPPPKIPPQTFTPQQRPIQSQPRPGPTLIGVPGQPPSGKIPPKLIPTPPPPKQIKVGGKIPPMPPITQRPVRPMPTIPVPPKAIPQPPPPKSGKTIITPDQLAPAEGVAAQVAVINGLAALMIGVSKVNTGPLVAAGTGWHIVPPFLAIHMSKALSLRNLMNWLMARFIIPDTVANAIMFQAQRFTSSRGNLMHANPANFSDMQNFLNIEHRRLPAAIPPKKQIISPYLMVFDEQIYLCFDIMTHPPGFIANMRRIKTLFRDPAAGIGEVNVYPATLITFFRDKQSAAVEMERVAKQYPINNLPEVQAELRSMVLNRQVTPKSVKH